MIRDLLLFLKEYSNIIAIYKDVLHKSPECLNTPFVQKSQGLYDKVCTYGIAMSVLKNMLKSNIITADEYSEIDTIIARENGLSSCTIFGETSDNIGFQR